MTTRFRKRPVEVEAVQFEGLDLDVPKFSAMPDWLEEARLRREGEPGAVIVRRDMASVRRRLIIETLEGDMEARHGDWIIRGTAGELYPCKPEIFTEIYEPVE